MEKKHDLLGIFLACATGTALLVALALRTFFPRMILPHMDAGTMVALSLAALVLDHYLVRGSRRDFRLLPLYGALVFGLFPFAAGFVAPLEALKLAVLGAVVFTAATFLFDTMADRLSTGPAAKIAPLLSAFGLFLACQCLMGIF